MRSSIRPPKPTQPSHIPAQSNSARQPKVPESHSPAQNNNFVAAQTSPTSSTPPLMQQTTERDVTPLETVTETLRLRDIAVDVAHLLSRCYYDYICDERFTGGVPRHVFEKEVLDGLLDGIEFCQQHPGERIPVHRDFLCQSCLESKVFGTCRNHPDRNAYHRDEALCRDCYEEEQLEYCRYHPDQQIHYEGLCRDCYDEEQLENCPYHPDQQIYYEGLCRDCYDEEQLENCPYHPDQQIYYEGLCRDCYKLE
ncbi:hypothetical protein B0H12DRAFT_1325103 [Mycena haematopus]|nr:hypothetical protein B0H12DRAFT_1325103 [Mycena haematopus]